MDKRQAWREDFRRRYREHPELYKWKDIKRRSLKLGLPFLMDRQTFAQWYLAQKKECEYCGLRDLRLGGKSMRGDVPLSFSIDRKDSRKAYSPDNMVPCCWNCNRLKNDFFTHEEFKKIAQKYIRPRWKAELNVA